MDHVSFFSEATLIEIGVYISSTVSLTNSESVWGKLFWDLFNSITSLTLPADDNKLADFLLTLNFKKKKNKLVTINCESFHLTLG